MTYTNMVLDKSHILAFIVNPNKGFKEHYVSSQPLNLYIPYSEYLALIKELVSLKLDILRTSISVYSSALSDGDYSSKMIKLYYYDIALSGLEEIRKSLLSSSKCTRIFGLMDVKKNADILEIDFNESANFVMSNFSDKQRLYLQQMIFKCTNIPADIIMCKNEELVDNIYMYLTSMSYMGIFKYKDRFALNVKEEL